MSNYLSEKNAGAGQIQRRFDGNGVLPAFGRGQEPHLGVCTLTYILETATSKGDATIFKTEIVENVTAHKSVLLALISALKRIRQTSYLVIYTDSNYVASNVRDSLARWKKNGWKTARGEPVKNQEEWQEIARLLQPHSFEVIISSSHSYYQWMKTESEKAAECI